MRISWVILTYNRANAVEKSIRNNIKNAGHDWHEVIWVDNGSHESCIFEENGFIDVGIFNKENLGVAKGYNRGVVLSTGTHILITGCDRIMPDQWLKTMVDYFEKIPETGVISIYSKPLNSVPERILSPIQTVNGLPLYKALPMEARLIRRDLIQKAGHLREDFGLYGHEDIEYGHRLKRVCDENGWIYYTIPMTATHLGTEGVQEYDGKDNKDYHEFKKKESRDPKKQELMKWCEERNYPYYNPYI